MSKTSPNWPYLYVPSTDEWNAAFGGKQDWSEILDAFIEAGGPQIGVTNTLTTLRANTIEIPAYLMLGGSAVADGGGGFFVYAPNDTTSADNGVTIIVDSAGHRWYLLLSTGGGSSTPEVATLTPVDGAVTVNMTGSNVYAVTLTANTTLNLTVTAPTGKYASALVFSKQGAGGSHSLSFPDNALWQGGYSPSQSTVEGALDLIQIITIDGGTTPLFAIVGQFAPVA